MTIELQNIRLFYKRRIFMTLVYRAPKLTYTNDNNIPGPGEYLIEPNICDKQPSSVFVSKVPRQNAKSDEKQPIGPGSYCGQLIKQQQKELASQPVFKSKIDRFKNDPIDTQSDNPKSIINEFCQIMKREREDKLKVGKVIGLKDKKKQKLSFDQHLPSIPTVQNSFGYRYDPVSHKMMINQNPKLIFAQTPKIAENEDDYFFQRSHGSLLTHSKKCNLNSSSKRSPSQIIYQLNNPNATQYHSQKYNCIEQGLKDIKNLSVFTSKVQRFGQQSPSKKEMLKLGKLKRDFGKYVNINVNLQQLQQSKCQCEQKQPSPEKQVEKKQFFMTKQPRFKGLQLGLEPISKTLTSVNQIIPLPNNKLKQKGKQIYGKGQERFKQPPKEHLGPGVYQIPEQRGANKAAILKLSQERFKMDKQNNSSPGPGYYKTDIKADVKEKVKYPFNRFRNQAYFQSQNKIEGKFSSMENLYQQVGKSMSYLFQVEKEEEKKKEKTKSNFNLKKNIDLSRDIPFNTVKKQIKLKIGSPFFQEIVSNQTKLQDTQNIRYSHLYNYSKPPEKTNGVGPGHYQVRTTLDKKTYNRTVPESSKS